jgi:hypothetical protein
MITDNKSQSFKNFVDDPYLNIGGKAPRREPKYPFNACGCDYSNCCGLAATGEETEEAVLKVPDVVKAKNITAWHYAKTALAVIGAFVLISYVWNKVKK